MTVSPTRVGQVFGRGVSVIVRSFVSWSGWEGAEAGFDHLAGEFAAATDDRVTLRKDFAPPRKGFPSRSARPFVRPRHRGRTDSPVIRRPRIQTCSIARVGSAIVASSTRAVLCAISATGWTMVVKLGTT